LIACGASWLKDPFRADYDPVDTDEVCLVKSYFSEEKIQLSREALGKGPEYRDYLRDDLKPSNLTYYRQHRGFDFSENQGTIHIHAILYAKRDGFS
jgi:hypothetical protein